MWRDIYMKAGTADELLAALPEAWKDAQGQPLLQGLDHALDVVGEMEGLDGQAAWHLNLRLREGVELPAALAGFELAVAQPRRQFA
jgi:hypothetical protein